MRAPAAAAVILTIAAVAGGCSPAASAGSSPIPATSAGPASVSPPSEPPSPTPEPTAAPAPSGTLLLPTTFAEEMEPGRYWSAPPFDLGFAFDVAAEGWVAGHLNDEFVDIQRFEGTPGVDLPTRIVGFAHPLQIHGTTIVDAANLTAAEAIDLWVERTDIETANVADIQLLGGDAVRVDVHAPTSLVPLFGGDDGTFRLDSAYDVRFVAIEVDGGLFLASVHAPAAELEAAWDEALPILESIDL